MKRRSRNHKWLMGFETKRVHCPDGAARTLTFQDYLWWQDVWARRDEAALERFDAVYGPGTKGSVVRSEPQEQRMPMPSVTATAASLLTRGIASQLRASGHA